MNSSSNSVMEESESFPMPVHFVRPDLKNGTARPKRNTRHTRESGMYRVSAFSREVIRLIAFYFYFLVAGDDADKVRRKSFIKHNDAGKKRAGTPLPLVGRTIAYEVLPWPYPIALPKRGEDD